MHTSPLTEREILERIMAGSKRTGSNTTIVAWAIVISFILACVGGLFWAWYVLVLSRW
jgi:hypothetical protein